ncbi:MAG: CarD family transcriptional regulator, partial [Deltaproteobacteria bacterium]|nr:CarD family transcriptional regulator [Deltaproteobacteria bacterium]
KIRTGSVYEVAEVYRDLLMLKVEKELSFGERKMLDTARGLLVKEISLAKKVEEEQIEKDLDGIFS